MYRRKITVLCGLILLMAFSTGIVDAQQANPYFYYANGQVVPLQLSTEWTAVRFGGVTNTAALASINGVGDVSKAVQLSNRNLTLVPLQAGASSASVASAIAKSAAVGSAWANPVFAAGDVTAIVTDTFLASFPMSMTEAQIDAYNMQFGVERIRRIDTPVENLWVLRVTRTSGINALDMANRYQTGGVALYGSPAFLQLMPARQAMYMPNDPLIDSQWHLYNYGQYNGQPGADIGAYGAWQVGHGDPNVIIAVLDDGMEITHPDLDSKIYRPYDMYAGDTNPTPDTPYRWIHDGHGTSVGGLAAAETNNSAGIAGVCPDCRLMPIRIAASIPTSEGPLWDLYTIDVIDAFYYATNNGAAIINNSWGFEGPFFDTALYNAINYASTSGRGGLGSLVVFSAGNSYNQPILFPANLDTVLTVGASNQCDQRKVPLVNVCNGNQGDWGNNIGASMDIAAPGMWLATTDLTGVNGYSGENGVITDSNYYDGFGGTSGAAPIVSGAAGLLLSADPSLDRATLKAILEYTTNDIVVGNSTGPGWDAASGWGRLSANNAMRLVNFLSQTPRVYAPTNATNRPTIGWLDWEWQEWDWVDWYNVEVWNNSTNPPIRLSSDWFQAKQICSSGSFPNCKAKLTTPLPSGNNYVAKVSPFAFEAGRISNLWTKSTESFSVQALMLNGPSGTISASYGNPTFSWNDMYLASYYYLQVANSSGQIIIDEVISDTGYCNGTTCSVDATKLRESNRLYNGSYTFRMRGWEFNGEGNWTNWQPFVLNAAPPAAAPALELPSNLNTLRPTFMLTVPGEAMWVNVVVETNGGSVLSDNWYSRTQACGSPSTTYCTLIQSATQLADNTQYRFRARTYGAGGFGPFSAYLNFAVDIPNPAVPTIPDFTMLNNGLVRLTWTGSTTVDRYNVWFGLSDYTSNIVFREYNRAEVCSGTTCQITLTQFVPNGTYTMWLLPINQAGNGEWTKGPEKVFNLPAPGAPVGLTSNLPAGSGRINLQWNVVNNAGWYNVTIRSAATNAVILNQWYQALSPMCGGATCSLTSSPLNVGYYIWTVTTYGAGGQGGTSNNAEFGVYFDVPPPVPVMPAQSFQSSTVKLQWPRNMDTTSYDIYVASWEWVILRYEIKQANEICDAVTCTYIIPNVSNNTYRWYMRAINPRGSSAWSEMHSVVVRMPAPNSGAPLLSPASNAFVFQTNRPTFTWAVQQETVWYNLEIMDLQWKVVFTQWMPATICGIDTCSFKLPTILPYGEYNWQVRTWNPAGFSPTYGSFNRLTSLSINTTPLYVQSDSGLMLNPGNWSVVQDSLAMDGRYATNAAGTSEPMSLTFEGSEVYLVYLVGPSFGSFMIELDGHPFQTIHANAAIPDYNYVVPIQGLPAGQHTVRIFPLDGASVAIDAFLVTPPLIPTAVPTTVPMEVIVTEAPTAEATAMPTEVPTEAATEVPTEAVTETPTEVATEVPTEIPTEVPTEAPVEGSGG